jgi:hypothetical protein
MKSAGTCAILALGLALSACNNEPEEAEDLTTAIPLDEEAGGNDAVDGGGDGDAMDGAPIEPSGPPISDTPGSGTMESGSNERVDIYGGEREGAGVPANSKLQRADPPS